MTGFAMKAATKAKSAKPGKKAVARPAPAKKAPPAKKAKLLPAKKVPVAPPGLDFGEFEALRRQLDLSLDDLAARLGLSRANIDRRKAAGRLTKDESDKIVRFARLLGHAAHLFGSLDEARRWLKVPQKDLGGAVPLDHARTEAGAREVENLLGRIAQGVQT
jgi:putative toxin-antitoxin system antitoxin component (TIGR02293 family)